VTSELPQIDEQINQSGETLQRFRGLPPQLKRDLRDLLKHSNNRSSVDRVLHLLKLYDRSIRFISIGHEQSIAPNQELSQNQQKQLSEQLLVLISELDFACESGSRLIGIQKELLLGVDAQSLIELSLETLKLVISGTHQERHSSQKFLTKLNTGIASILKSSNSTVNQSQSHLDKRTELRKEFSSLVNQASETLNNNKHLDPCRDEFSDIFSQLQVLEEHQKVMEERELELLEKIKQNENQLSAFYEETKEYRRRLGEQEKRMHLDHLTKVSNRAALSERIDTDYKDWLRSQQPLCCAMIDIDNFKQINDKFGHLAGDKALKIIAKTMQDQLRRSDFIARFRGEEFVILLPNCEQKQRNLILNNIKQSVSELPFKFKNNQISITVTIGATTFIGNDVPEEVVERSDKALLQAKAVGRNQLVWL
jgi:diguanylate cyclase (GGDEF)-like protein